MVDVPGHEDFVKNMVAGVGAVDVALFVVAADDGWMPQTEEHLEILTYLGVKRAVVALTKIDLAADEPAAIAAVRARLRLSPFEAAPIVPTSVGHRPGAGRVEKARSPSRSPTRRRPRTSANHVCRWTASFRCAASGRLPRVR